MIDERKAQKQTEASTTSVTSSVKIYHIPSTWIKESNFTKDGSLYCINIIDTPGFGDTRGIEMEASLNTMIQETLKGLNTVDNILLVVKSTETRLAAA